MTGGTSRGYGRAVALADTSSRFGDHLRWWRHHRRFSQLELGLSAGVSAKHVSFLETGRSSPSREMVLHLARHLDVPLRHQNDLLTAAGFSPQFGERSLDDDAMAEIRQVIELQLAHHQPYPAICVDRRWDLISANAAAQVFLEGVSAPLLEPPVNVMRISLHPNGLAPRVRNFTVYAGHLVARLRAQAAHAVDPGLVDLLDEVSAYPGVRAAAHEETIAGPVLPLRIDIAGVEVALVSTIASIGAPQEITTAELAVEAFYPADEASAAVLGEVGRSAGSA